MEGKKFKRKQEDKKMRLKQSLKEILEKVTLKNEAEQDLVNQAIVELDKGEYEPKVQKQLRDAFNKLVLQGKISKEGLSFFEELSKPNFDVDLALSSMTWFN